MTAFANEMKPPMEDYFLEHYGVKGMKWGVRRSQAALDRAAGRRTAKANKGPSQSKQIRTARKNVLQKRRQEFKNADSISKKAEIFLKGEFANNLSLEYRANPDRKIAFQRTTGERVATTILAIPSLGTAAAYELGNQTMNKAIRNDQELAAIKLAMRDKK